MCRKKSWKEGVESGRGGRKRWREGGERVERGWREGVDMLRQGLLSHLFSVKHSLVLASEYVSDLHVYVQ